MSDPIERVLRTPDSAFANISGWDWGSPHYFTSTLFGASIRIAYWDLGPRESPTVLLTHGEPAWSYLNRRLVKPLLSAGFRVVLFDQVGFGRSDKPSAAVDYSYSRHVAWNEDLLFNHLNLRDITVVLQDWGGILGLRVAARNPERFSRMVLSNTVFPTCEPTFEGENYISKGFFDWKQFVYRGGLRGRNKIGQLFSRAALGPSCVKMSEEEIAAYQAPFPTDEFAAGAHVFPELVPTPPSDQTGRPQPEGGAANRALWAVFQNWTKPVLLAFGENDPVLGHGHQLWSAKCPGTKGLPHITLKGAGHFSQDGGGEQLAKAIVDLVHSTPSGPRSKL